MKDNTLLYTLQLADNAMILGQRLAEWCGHGPVLEQDIAITNISLDMIGEARMLYQYAAELHGDGVDEDYFPYHRDARHWRNVLLVEIPNGHFGHTMVRQCMYDCFHYYLMDGLTQSRDNRLAEIATKTIKEASYHLKYSSEWMIRLGDGTDESHQKMQGALDDYYIYFEELFVASDEETALIKEGIAVDLSTVAAKAKDRFVGICQEATLQLPKVHYPQRGGKQGLHTEHLGFVLTELQYLQKSYPGAKW